MSGESKGSPRAYPALVGLFGERDDGVDARRPAGGQRAREYRYAGEHRSDGADHHRVRRADAEQLALEAAPQRDGARGAEHEADGDEREPFTEHQLEDGLSAAA